MEPPPEAELGDGPGPRRPADGAELRCLELCPICRGAEVLRQGGSPELRGGLRSVQREALLTMRALIDSYVERLDDEPGARGPRVEDIPIR